MDNPKIRLSLLALVIFAVPIGAVPGLCQTVGNGTVFAPAAGAREGYGINSFEQSNGSSYPSMHMPGGNGSGIGSSFIRTTSPTSESSPAVRRPSFVADTVQQFHLPKLESGFSGETGTPALQLFNPAVPKLPRSSALADPLASPLTKPNTFQPIEELPSFSKKRSVTDWMRF